MPSMQSKSSEDSTAAGSQQTPPLPSTHNSSIAIIGAGFSGICMGIKLKLAQYNDFTIYEAADEIGGTWRDNTYPGCSCDIPSVQYHFSFEPVIWDEPYVSQPKILQYMHHCVSKYDLGSHIRLNTKVSSAVFDETVGMWHITTDQGEESWVQVLVLAQGGLAIPTIPNIPGLKSFPGAVFHTAKWDHSCDLRNKRVAVVGTGASAVQVIPCIQPLVQKLFVFQRTPNWVISRGDYVTRSKYVSLSFAAAAVAAATAVAAAGAGCIKGRKAAATVGAAVAAVGIAAVAGSRGVRLWFQRQSAFWMNELMLGSAVTRNNQATIAELTRLGLNHLEKSVPDPELRAKLTPSYTIGCKRILGSDTYYQAIQQDNVELICSAVEQVGADGSITAADGSKASDVDAIIFATGFDVAASLQFRTLTVKGLGGRDLSKTLAENPYGTYLGLAVSGFPNMFILLGPNTWLGHNSMIFMIECGVNMIMKMIRRLQSSQGRLKWWEVDESAQQRFGEEAQTRLQGSVWLSGGCSSWYLPKTASQLTNNKAANTATSAVASGVGGEAADVVSSRYEKDEQSVELCNESSGSRVSSCVMWVGICVEYWWRTLWIKKGDWKEVAADKQSA